VKLVVGFGNPGARYAGTRHNVGFRIVDQLARERGVELSEKRFSGRFGIGRVGDDELALLEPQTFMNRSGAAVGQAVEGLGIAQLGRDLLLVFDDIDLPLGRIRVRGAGSAGGHRGLADAIEVLGTSELARLRFGVGRPAGGSAAALHVLDVFTPDEELVVRDRVAVAVRTIESVFADGIREAMNRYNGPPPEAPLPGAPEPEET